MPEKLNRKGSLKVAKPRRPKKSAVLAINDADHFKLVKCFLCPNTTSTPYFLAARCGPRILWQRVYCPLCYKTVYDALCRLPYFAVIE
jgi:hypothetical protein